MTEQTCTACRMRPTRDVRLLCDQCVWELERCLGRDRDNGGAHSFDALVTHLNVTLNKQSKMSSEKSGQHANAKSHPLLFDIRASDILDTLRITLSGWARVLMEDHQLAPPADTLQAMAAFLHAHLDRIATHEAAGDIHDEIVTVCRRGWQAVDWAADKIWAGRCGARVEPDGEPGDGLARGGVGHWECDEDVYAKPGAVYAICHCGARHDVKKRREAMLEDINMMLFTGPDIARMASHFTDLDSERCRKLIASWAERGRITPHQRNSEGKPMYPFGELLQMLLATPKRTRQAA